MRADIGSLVRSVAALDDFSKTPDTEHEADGLASCNSDLGNSFVNEACV